MSDTSLAVPDGMRLSDWWTARAVPRSTAFRLVRIAGIEPEKVRVDGSRSPVSFLAADQVAALNALADKLKNGVTITQLEGALSRLSRPETAPDPEPAVSDGQPGPELLLARLEAAQLAMATGLPLTTAEIAWLIGARPGGDLVTRAKVTARRHSRNCWSLEPARDG